MVKCHLCDKEATHMPGGFIFDYKIEGETINLPGILEKPLCDEHFEELRLLMQSDS